MGSESRIIRIVLLLVAWAATACQPSMSVARQISERDAEFLKRLQHVNRMVRKYSRQRIVALGIGEQCSFELNNGDTTVIRLVSVEEHRYSLINRMQWAGVVVTVDGRRLELVCSPYVMPTEVAGLRIQADATAGWPNIPDGASKKVQFSLWDAGDPIVDTNHFGFPIADYRLFSHGTQSFNEVVHLGTTDGTPRGPNFHHDYGFDMAGFEGREKVLSCVEGRVVEIWDGHSVAVCDDQGLIFTHGHLDSIAPGVRAGVRVRKGQPVGILGKKGPSGDFSHLHVGTYLSEEDRKAGRANVNLNLYPWFVTAYERQSGQRLCAVARPHHVIVAGEKARFDGSNSLAFGTEIVKYQWLFHDGDSVETARVEKQFHKPGTYIAELWIWDGHGVPDVDFCKIRVFSKTDPEPVMPTLFLTYTPAKELSAGQTVYVRGWLQGGESANIRLDFGDGTILEGYQPYSVVEHRYAKAGIHILSGYASVDNKPVTQKLKIVVAESRR
ncbi:MAG: peptidoglycan DD-metalloendopeptidase family protein [Phycisphaerales bacterium]|nr:MAG: peptidoglycan DD-metalloendopeptidase family protein [Phycisphaerales bacterium]